MHTAVQQVRIFTLTCELKIAHLTVDKLKLEVSNFRRLQYGRPSVKSDHAGQMELMDSMWEPVPATNDSAASNVSPLAGRKKDTGKTRPGLHDLPSHLRRQTVVHHRQGGACNCVACCNCHNITRTVEPSRPVTRARVGARMMAPVLMSKYADHMPLYRWNQIFAHDGVELAVFILMDIVGGAAWLLTPLAQAVGRYVPSGAKIHGADTPIRVLGGATGKAKTGRLLVYVRDDRGSRDTALPAVWFQYSADRKGEHPRRHRREFHVIAASERVWWVRQVVSGWADRAGCMLALRQEDVLCHPRAAAHILASTLEHETLQRIAAIVAIGTCAV